MSQKGNAWFTDALKEGLSENVSKNLQEHYNKTQTGRLRISKLSPRCPKALWHSVHTPELAEDLPPWVKLKFSYGHIVEAQAIALMKAAGHEVTGEQDELVADGVVGHRDCVVDGCILDVKSCSGPTFLKIKTGKIAVDDGFGYLDQLDGYLLGSAEDPLVRVKDRAYLLAVDKVLGHLHLYEHKFRKDYIQNRIAVCKAVAALSSPPACTCGTVAHQGSGNMMLDVPASYSEFKHCCFPDLKTALYKSGPVHLTKIVRWPDVNVIDKNGKFVYN